MLNNINEKRDFVFLDLDDTILDFGKAERAALSKTLSMLGIEPTEDILSRYSAVNVKCWEQLEDGILTRDEVLVRRFEILFSERGVVQSASEANCIYEKLLGIGHYFIPGAEELLSALSGKYRLYIASNGAANVQASRLDSAGIEKFFDGIFISENIGFDKPRKEFFERCFSSIPEFRRDRAIMVGDSLSSDIRGGINAGIKTCWFNAKNRPPRDDIKPNYEIKELNALPGLLDSLFDA